LVENYARYTIVILQKQAMGFTENLSFLSILLVICFHKFAVQLINLNCNCMVECI